MSWSAYWPRRCAANPRLLEPETKMTITVDSFRREQERAYREGQQNPEPPRRANFISDLIDGIFGK